MTSTIIGPTPEVVPTPPHEAADQGGRRRRGGAGSGLIARGEPMLWLTGGALVLALFMITALLLLVLVQGMKTFWPVPVVRMQTESAVLMGEITRSEQYMREVDGEEVQATRHLLRTGNFELTNTHFHWVAEPAVVQRTEPKWATVVERIEWGRFYGMPKAFLIEGEPAVSVEGLEGDALDQAEGELWRLYREHAGPVADRRAEIRHLEKDVIGEMNFRKEHARLDVRRAELSHGVDSPQYAQAQAAYERVAAQVQEEFDEVRVRIAELRAANDRLAIRFETAQDVEKVIPLGEIVRAYTANQLSLPDKFGVYLARWWEFLSADPREANSEGGVFPAIFGTVLMTLLMCVLVVPFGVLAALYMREYATSGTILSIVRIAINNLAGVPSIVFGVFGLGFFCYIVGVGIDELLFEARLPNPTFGKGALVWASFTLALLTLPVVIVATEEALSAVPNSMREGSYACGASKWQTIKRIVLPRAMPGIMTGTILAMARGAGEVAPLMLVGAVKLAPELPLSPHASEGFGINRSFMHLGFHIYDLGFQSQNSEAAKPMVFTTTLLLITIVVVLNLAAIYLRSRLKRRFVSSAF